MAKLALCVNRSDVPVEITQTLDRKQAALIPIDPSFYDIETHLVDRAICDNVGDAGREVAEQTLQLLPYISLYTADGRMFTYTRGGSGEEARLHGNYSIGLGGHVDLHPIHSLLELLKLEAIRECYEEAKLSLSLDKFHFSHFIVDGTNPVGRVHLGLLCSVLITEDQLHELEADVIEAGRFHTEEELHATETHERMENWSKMVVGGLMHQASFPSATPIRNHIN